MLIFKRNIFSQITKRQTQDRIMKELDAEIKEQDAAYERELEMSYESEEEDEGGRAALQKKLNSRLM